MTPARLAAALAIALLAACSGKQPLALPEAPVDRAAACAVVAAAEARVAIQDINAPLPVEAQGRIVHYALLAASRTGAFDAETANAVNKRVGEIKDKLTSGPWQTLIQPCRASYPAAGNDSPELPKNALDSELACEQLAEFLANALEAQGRYRQEVADYRRLRGRLNDRLASALKARVGGSLAAQQEAGRKALARAASLGSPVAVMRLCAARFG
jgi:predicted small lipoprotein YifL